MIFWLIQAEIHNTNQATSCNMHRLTQSQWGGHNHWTGLLDWTGVNEWLNYNITLKFIGKVNLNLVNWNCQSKILLRSYIKILFYEISKDLTSDVGS